MANTMKFGNGQWATKEDSILAYNDENANFKPLPFVTSRASTATRVNKAGLLETVASGIPRVDYLGNTKGAYLLEPQSTNLVTYSEDFSQSIWQKNSTGSASAPIITSNFAISPTGNTNATRVQFNISGSTSSDKSSLEHLFQLDGSSSYTLSFYIKSNTGVNQNLSFFTNSNYGNRITTTNKWIRVVQTFSSNSAFNRGFGLVSSGDVQQTVDVLIFGAQIEQKSYATSYIKTSGSQITRLAEYASQTVPDGVINSSEGVLYWCGKSLANDGLNRRISLSDGSGSNRIVISFSSSNNIQIFIVVAGVAEFVPSFVTDITQTMKIALSFALNKLQFWVNGALISEDLSSSIFTENTLNTLNFADGTGSLPFYSKTKDLRVYNTVLTDAELAKLTKI